MQQSPLPFVNGGAVTFTVTKDNGPPLPVDRLAGGRRPDPQRHRRRSPTPTSAATTGVKASLWFDPGLASISRVAGDGDGTDVVGARSRLSWSTVVGSRVNCTSVCWSFVSVPAR